MIFAQLCDFYLNHQRTYNRPTSVDSCNASLRVFKRIFGEDMEVRDFSPQNLHEFVSKRREENIRSTSINANLRVMKALFNWSVEMGYLEELPFKIKMLKAPKKREFTPLTREEIRKLVTWAPGYLKVLIHLGAVTGMRLGEMLSLRWRDIGFQEGMVTIQGENAKSHQQRSIPLGEESIVLFQEYRDRTKFKEDADLLFCTRDGKRLMRPNVSRKLQQVWKDAGVYQKGVPTTHGLRHAAATWMLQQGTDIETVREILGHCSITVTELYLHTDQQKKKSAVEHLSL